MEHSSTLYSGYHDINSRVVPLPMFYVRCAVWSCATPSWALHSMKLGIQTSPNIQRQHCKEWQTLCSCWRSLCTSWDPLKSQDPALWLEFPMSLNCGCHNLFRVIFQVSFSCLSSFEKQIKLRKWQKKQESTHIKQSYKSTQKQVLIWVFLFWFSNFLYTWLQCVPVMKKPCFLHLIPSLGSFLAKYISMHQFLSL